ncbi:response regulator transcription factor [Mucilaginibacter polytrichastri]|uniref:Response regulator mprA n=1 Tax=Mucilaginibacter polytrichastri TaxID=1302689 RepID=A0A1Q5ZYQ6_9SPHI|nr:response regulator transcription factor [Mucilaginibacter polytrichastri]OKS86881.1 Response regulator mprA [Mucilaginibacter polytrichastri]SFT17710.1 two component transcriptional regulator, winged helix family [Mucilaginibacter polytrichastri]
MAVLLVEDEPNVVSVIKRGLAEHGFEISVATDGLTGLQMAIDYPFDIIILDVMLPSMDGIQICKHIREHNENVPILMLTALDSTENIVNGLNSGADDYLVKPFKMIELAARLKTLMRRRGSEAKSATHTYKIAGLELDADAKLVTLVGEPISLTSTEYRLLEYFIKNQKKVLSRIQILENVWDIDFNLGTNVVDVYINYLRKKLDKSNSSRFIQTVFGMGYIMKDND